MNVTNLRPHRWDLSPMDAQDVQQELASLVKRTDRLGDVLHVAGVVTGHSRFNDVVTAAVAVVRLPDLKLVASAVRDCSTRFPFIPDLMSFREGPAVMAALQALPITPDLLLVEAPGIAHPRGLGLASHVGVLTDLPTVGCARSTMVGSFVEPEVNAGSRSALVWQGEIIGTVLRSKNRTAPLFVSVGHRVGLDTAIRLVQEVSTGYRLPEPTRMAGNLLADARQAAKETAS